MVQKEKNKSQYEIFKTGSALASRDRCECIFVLVGVQYTCDVPEVRTDSVSVVSKIWKIYKKYIKQENTYHILFKITIKNRGTNRKHKIYKKNV